MARTARSSIVLIAVFALLFANVALAATPAAPASKAAARFNAYGHAGTFLLQRDGAGPQIIHGADWSTKPQPPASTFKVMLALIALETGALRSADEVLKWDGTPYPDKPEWQKDMALREAMQTSSEHYFGVLAKRIGRERLAEWVTRVGYGNGRVGPNPSGIWHDGVLAVTAQQQLAFVDRLRRGALPFSAKTIATTKTAMYDGELDGRLQEWGYDGALLVDCTYKLGREDGVCKRFWHGDTLAFQKQYFEHLAESAETGLFDSLAHPDLVKNASPAETSRKCCSICLLTSVRVRAMSCS